MKHNKNCKTVFCLPQQKNSILQSRELPENDNM